MTKPISMTARRVRGEWRYTIMYSDGVEVSDITIPQLVGTGKAVYLKYINAKMLAGSIPMMPTKAEWQETYTRLLKNCTIVGDSQ